MTDSIMISLRAKYPKRGPNPGKDILKWATNYSNDIADKIDHAEALKKSGFTNEDISAKTGLRKETVAMLFNPKNKKKG